MVYITYLYGDLGDGLWNCFAPIIIVTSTISPNSSPSQPSQFSYRLGTSTQHCFTNIWLVVWNIFYFSIQLGRIIPAVFHIFQRGRYTTNQIWFGLCFTIVLPNIYPTFTQHVRMIMCHVRCFHPFWGSTRRCARCLAPRIMPKRLDQARSTDFNYGDSMWFSKKHGNCSCFFLKYVYNQLDEWDESHKSYIIYIYVCMYVCM